MAHEGDDVPAVRTQWSLGDLTEPQEDPCHLPCHAKRRGPTTGCLRVKVLQEGNLTVHPILRDAVAPVCQVEVNGQSGEALGGRWHLTFEFQIYYCATPTELGIDGGGLGTTIAP